MSDDNNSQTAASKAPSHIAYQVREGKGDKGYWPKSDRNRCCSSFMPPRTRQQPKTEQAFL